MNILIKIEIFIKLYLLIYGEVFSFLFKNDGGKVLNDVVYHKLFDLESIDFLSINVTPKTNYWRLGIRLSKDEHIEFFSSRDRHLQHRDFKDIHIGKGDWKHETNEWYNEERIYIAQYNFVDEPHISNELFGLWDKWILNFVHDQELKLLTVEFQDLKRTFQLGDYRYFKLFAWADNIEFELDCHCILGSYDLDQKKENEKKVKVKVIHNANTLEIKDIEKDAINVEAQAKEMLQIMRHFGQNQGMMVGVFGKWGRGKTFFWKTILKQLKKGDKFIPIEFNAWKYQDTPASWAYLYETIVEKFLDIYPWWHPKRYLIIVILNFKKYGFKPIGIFLLGLGISFYWYFGISSEIKQEYALKLIKTLGVIYIIYLLIIFFKHIPKAKDIFQQYNSISRYKMVLGLQSEIQDELGVLVRSWLSNDNKILLFVDDIDRCNEERIIEIIDALRIMLDHKEISKKMVVLAAIDNESLSKAINFKLSNQIKNHSHHTEIKTSEYMDKLFICGIKLTNLTEVEKQRILQEITRDQIDINKEDNLNTNNIADINTVLDSKFVESRKNISFEVEYEEQKNQLTLYEYQILEECLKHFEEATPRQIRIYYYRYLLAKRLIDHLSEELKVEWYTQKDFKSLALLILEYSKYKTLSDRKGYIDILLKSPKNHLTGMWEVRFKGELLKEIAKIVDMVVAY